MFKAGKNSITVANIGQNFKSQRKIHAIIIDVLKSRNGRAAVEIQTRNVKTLQSDFRAR